MFEPRLTESLITVLDELTGGPAPSAALLLNSGDAGLLRSLDKLSAETASARPASGGASIAAHVDHLRYGLELLNRSTQGEDPFADAAYSASWKHGAVSESEWASLRAAIRTELVNWREALKSPQIFSHLGPSVVFASITHIAYHFGAIRQINRSIRGPAARD